MPWTWDLFLVLDLFGTLVFAVTGAFRAVKYELDVLGVLVLAVFTGVGGGIIRDILLGVFPPVVFIKEVYFLVCIAGGLLVFFVAPRIARWWNWVKIADAIGLGVFAALGALKAFDHGLGPIGVIMLGTITAVGGGVIRDILVREIPAVIQTDVYATAAALGSLVLYLCKFWGLPDLFALTAAAGSTLGIRGIAMALKLNLPRVRNLPSPPGEIAKYWKRIKHKKNRSDS